MGGEEGGGQGEGEGGGRGRGQLGGHLVQKLLDGREIVTAVLLQHLGQQTLKTIKLQKLKNTKICFQDEYRIS